MKKIFLVGLLALCSLVTFAQQSNIKFRHLTIKDGLSQSDVSSILQDDKGLMWFGTQDGLNVYNGFNFNVFSHDLSDSNSISNNFIRAVLQDSSGLIWVATESGLNVFDRGSYAFKTVFRTQEKHNTWALTETKKYIWAGTEKSLIKIEKHTLKASNVSLNLSTLTQKLKVRKLTYLEKTRDIFIATEGNGLIKYNIDLKESELFYQDNSLLKSDVVWDVLVDTESKIWIATNQGINFYDLKSKRLKSDTKLDKIIGNKLVKCLYEDKSGILWLGTETNGLYKYASYNNVDHYVYNANVSTSLSSNKVNTIYEDNSGIIWVGTQSGVDKFDKQKQFFKHYQYWPNKLNSINSNMVWSIFQNNGDFPSLWVGTDKGINIFDKSTGEVSHITPTFKSSDSKNTGVYSFCKDYSGKIIAGTDGGAFEVINNRLVPVGGVFNEKNTYRTYTIFEDNQKRLWLGTKEGLVVISKNRKEFKHILSSDSAGALSSDVVRAISQTKSGTIWVGTDGGGLCKVVEGVNGDIKFKVYTRDIDNPNTLSNNTVLSIHEDKNGKLWIGTFGGGLNVFNPKTEKFFAYTEKDGLSNNVIYGVAEDKKGNLWMSTNKGISQYFIKRNKFRIFEESDGLQSNEFNTGAYFQSSTGALFFGGINGFNAFYPEDIHINKSKPKPIITNFYLFNKPVKIGEKEILKKHISELDEIVLKHRQNVISFEFASLHYSYPLKNLHKYKLENFNEEWVEIGNSRRANYTNLDPGEYVFKVMVANSDGIWSDEVAKVRVIVEPPFWRTWWFISIVYILLPLLLVYVFVRYRINQVKRQKMLLELQVRERTQEVTRQKELLEKEKEKTEKLLLNVLPAETAEELKSKGKATARSYRMTSIMFTDFKSFTQIAEVTKPQELVAELDGYFVNFDEIIEKYDVEKIKTIGDAYMC
ncbi:MAG: two-component regulator propeller domain-containing protein, partial [Vicingaceae bacterium]|nr:two-component regulator propeller domain-containing protein [Vicingaceae bacterium]